MARLVWLLVSLGSLSFALTVIARRRQASVPVLAVAADSSTLLSDSTRLAEMGFHPGRHLVAFVFGGSRCRLCSSSEMTEAVRAMRRRLVESNHGSFAQISVVGVAINTDVEEGLRYLGGFGIESFDEISVGKGWLNENAARWIWSDTTAAVGVPRVVLVSRSLDARLDPIELRFSADSVLRVVSGAQDVVKWVADGAFAAVAR